MSVAKSRRLLALTDYAHASASISQLRNSAMLFQNHSALTVPPTATCEPQYHSLLVARLKLPTSRHVDDFSAILRKYDMRKTLKAAATASRRSSSLALGTMSSASIVEEINIHAGVLPLRVNILGLGVGEGGNPASTTVVQAKPIDPTNRLAHFLLSLRDLLATTRFVVNPGNEDTARRYMGDDIMIVNTFSFTVTDGQDTSISNLGCE